MDFFSSLNQRYDIIIVLIDMNCLLKSAMWPMGLLFICHYVIGCFIFRGKDFRASITVLMTASSYCFCFRCKLIRGFIFVQMKGTPFS